MIKRLEKTRHERNSTTSAENKGQNPLEPSFIASKGPMKFRMEVRRLYPKNTKTPRKKFRSARLLPCLVTVVELWHPAMQSLAGF